MMEINNDINNNEIPFSSFLAACLLVRRSISNSELCNISSDFTVKYGVYFGEDSNDVDYEHISFLFSEGSGFELKYGYNDLIKLNNGRKISVYDYLYKYTHPWVRTYFDLPCNYNPSYIWNMESSIKKIRG